MFILSLYILFKAIKKYNLQGSCELLFRPKIKLNARQKKIWKYWFTPARSIQKNLL